MYRSDDPIEAEPAPYRDAKDTLRLPYSAEQPDELITRVAAFLARSAHGRGFPARRVSSRRPLARTFVRSYRKS